MVSLSAVAYLLSEIISYCKEGVQSASELEDRLSDMGYPVGVRLLELVGYRDRKSNRETRILGILQFVHTHIWACMFGRRADSIEKGTEGDNEYMINDTSLALTKYVSVPKEMGSFTPAAFMAGVVRGVLDAAGFPATVTAHLVPVEGQPKPRTTILIAFSDEVLLREQRLSAAS